MQMEIKLYIHRDPVINPSTEFVLNPDHLNHQNNMNSLSRMELLILNAYLGEIKSTIQTALRYQAQEDNKKRMIANGILTSDG